MKWILYLAMFFVFIVAAMVLNTSDLQEIPLANAASAVAPISYKLNDDGNTIATRFTPPDGFIRREAASGSYASFLRSLPLKLAGSEVLYYNGQVKSKPNVYAAVVDLPIGNKDLHQCADAVMRLRAEYLFELGQYEDIHFNFTNGFRVDYEKWMQGSRIVVDGNKVSWKQSASPSNTKEDLWSYLETIFTYAGTLSLDKELQAVEMTDMQIGDVFIKGGSPGHAVVVVDMVESASTEKRLFLLAQSYMPAQEIQVLKNPNENKYGDWYEIDLDGPIQTPEWTFKTEQLKRFAP